MSKTPTQAEVEMLRREFDYWDREQVRVIDSGDSGEHADRVASRLQAAKEALAAAEVCS